jgi:hypothetical protein
MEFLFSILMGTVICGAIGGICAERRGRGGSGFVLGFMLGPLGIILALFLPENPKRAADAAVKRAREEYKKPDPLEEFEARERARTRFESVPKHLRGRKVDEAP